MIGKKLERAECFHEAPANSTSLSKMAISSLLTDPLFLGALLLPAVVAAVLVMSGYSEFSHHWLADRPKAILWYVLLLPVVEELAFRGWLQGQLSKTTYQRYVTLPGLTFANILTSTLFSLLHIVQQPSYWAAATIFPSLVFGFFRDRYPSVMPGMVLHIVYNTGFLLLTF